MDNNNFTFGRCCIRRSCPNWVYKCQKNAVSIILSMITIFNIAFFLSACGSTVYQSVDDMKESFNDAIYTCYDEDGVKAQLLFAGDKVTKHTFYDYIGDSEYTYDIEDWKYNSDTISLDFLNEKIRIIDFSTIQYDGDTYELGNISEETLTGNPFLDASDADSVDSSGGLIRKISLSKSEASAAGQEEYKEFIDQRVSKMNSHYEMLIVGFDDGTGIIYYGCDPSNNMYGELSWHVITEPYGYIVQEDDGTYSYHEFEE